ncbi:MAG: helix-turn-helix transcriptional regulator [Gemmatimonadota bacterium]
MKHDITEEWCRRMAQLEAGAEVGAGVLARAPTALYAPPHTPPTHEDINPAFGRFVQLMRRRHGLTLEKLADDADVEVFELVGIEEDPRHKPQLRSVYQLASYFRVPQGALLQVSGLMAPDDAKLFNEAIRFAARSESVAALTREEQAALEAFVVILNERASPG